MKSIYSKLKNDSAQLTKVDIYLFLFYVISGKRAPPISQDWHINKPVSGAHTNRIMFFPTWRPFVLQKEPFLTITRLWHKFIGVLDPFNNNKPLRAAKFQLGQMRAFVGLSVDRHTEELCIPIKIDTRLWYSTSIYLHHICSRNDAASARRTYEYIYGCSWMMLRRALYVIDV